MRHKLHADAAAREAWDELMLSTIGLGTAARRAAAGTTRYAASGTFAADDQATLASPVLDRHEGLLTPDDREALTEDAPSLVALVTEAGDGLADDTGNLLVGWI